MKNNHADPVERRRLRNARITAMTLGLFLTCALLAFVYAFIQQAKAKTQEKLAVENARMAVEMHKLAKQLESELAICRNQRSK